MSVRYGIVTGRETREQKSLGGLMTRRVTYWNVLTLTGRRQTLSFPNNDVDWSVVDKRGPLKVGDLVQVMYLVYYSSAVWRLTQKMPTEWKVWTGVASAGPGCQVSLVESSCMVGPLDWAIKTLYEHYPQSEHFVNHQLFEVSTSEPIPTPFEKPASAT